MNRLMFSACLASLALVEPGAAEECVRCQLSADTTNWEPGDAPTLRVEIENLGKLSRPVHLKEGFHQVEVDGKIYAWAGTVTSVTDPFTPGSKAEIRFTLAEKNWAPLDEKEARVIEKERLQLKAGKHTVRVRIQAGDISVNPLVDQNFGPPVRVWSNAVEIEVGGSSQAGDETDPSTPAPPKDADAAVIEIQRDVIGDRNSKGDSFSFTVAADGAWEYRPAGKGEAKKGKLCSHDLAKWVKDIEDNGFYKHKSDFFEGGQPNVTVTLRNKDKMVTKGFRPEAKLAQTITRKADELVRGEATVEMTVSEVGRVRTSRGTRADESEPLTLVGKADGDLIHVDVSWEAATRLKRLGIEDLAEHFRGKVVRVRGPVEPLTRRPGPAYRIEVKNLDQFEDIRTAGQLPVDPDSSAPTPAEAAALRDRLLAAAKTNKPLTITPKVGVGPVKFGMSAAEVEAALGKPFRMTDRAKEYQHLGLAVVMDKEDRVAAILVGAWCEASDILLDVFKGGTEAGVRLRADRGQVVQAHGEPSAVRSVGSPEAEFEVLTYDALRTEFALRKGKLIHVTLKR